MGVGYRTLTISLESHQDLQICNKENCDLVFHLPIAISVDCLETNLL